MPTVADILQFGLAAHRAGKSDVAERAYRQILEFDRDQTDALHLMAVLDCQRGRFAQAIDGIARAMALRADQPGYRLTYADALVGVGRLDQAVAIYRDILSAADDVAEAHAGLAGALQRLGRFDDAVRHYRRVVALGALDADRLENFGIAAISSGDFAAAADALWRAVALAPERAMVQMHLGLAMQWLRRKPDAYQRYRMALALDPDCGDARHRLGKLLFGDGDTTGAMAAYGEALHRAPDHGEAARSYLQTMILLPEMEPRRVLEERRRWSDHYARPIEEQAIAAGALRHANDRDPERRLRIAYLGGAALSGTTVVHTLLPLLQAHDPAQVETFCYSDLHEGHEDGFTQRYRAAAAHWRRTAGLDDGAMAAQLRRDRIDLMVDLVAHMGGPRVLVFAHRPAPIQAALYTTATTGQAGYDYLIADATLVPPDQAGAFSEEIIRLPCGYLFQPQLPLPPPVPEPPSRRTGRTTFGSMNLLAKASDRSVALWSRVLAALPQSRLLIKGESFADEAGRRRMIERFAVHGIGADRLDLRSNPPSYGGYIELFNEIDILLDTMPYNGITTTCEALWMGVPVVTRAEERVVGRYGMLLLGGVGLEECIGCDDDEFVARAVTLARTPERLAALRVSLRDRVKSSPVSDAAGAARALESVYRDLWRRWCRRGGGGDGHGR